MSRLKFSNVDLLSEQFEVNLGDRHFVAQREGPEIYFLSSDQKKALGHIYVGNPNSGAIYLGNECIAEFDRTDDRYIIRPVTEGRRDPHKRVEGDPVEYFFTHLQQ